MTIELITPATPELIQAVASAMREADLAELAAGGYEDPEHALRLCVAASQHTGVLLYDGEPAVLMGVHVPSVIGNSCAPWLLSTAAVERYPLSYTREMRKIVAMLAEHYGRLENYVDARYQRAVRWLGLIGFTVLGDEHAIDGPNGHRFLRFVKEA